MAEKTSKRVARENFAMSTVPILQSALFEPLLHQPRDGEEEGMELLFLVSMNISTIVFFRSYG
jgi:hypothetical protein